MLPSGSGVSGFDVSRVLIRAMDTASLREQVLANNVANIDTPGFKRSDVDFNAALRQSMGQGSAHGITQRGISARRTMERHSYFPRGADMLSSIRESWYTQRNSENNVSIEVENSLRDQNQLLYSAAAQMYGDRMKWLTHVLDVRR